MSHQPVVPNLQDSSSEVNTVGGVISSQPFSKFMFSPVEELFNVDELAMLPFYSRTIDFSPSNASLSLLYSTDPFAFLMDATSANSPLPWAIPYLQSCYFYDFDLDLTFLAIKHERSRGRILFVWTPSSINGLTPVANTTGVHSRSMKWIWDLESSDTFSIRLIAPKHLAWRDRRVLNKSFTASTNYMLPGTGTAVTNNNAAVGTLEMYVLDSYSAGLLGPDLCPILWFTQLQNVSTAEYKPPFSGYDSFLPFYNTTT